MVTAAVVARGNREGTIDATREREEEQC